MSDDVRAPLGWRLDGRPIWACSGGADDDGDTNSDGESDEGEGDGDEGGDGDETDIARLNKAIDAERKATKTAKDSMRPFLRLMRDLGVKDADGLRDLLDQGKGKQTEDEKAKADREAAVIAKANKRIVGAEIRAKAAQGFADVDDAVRNLDIDDYDVDDDGNVDEKAIERDLKDLLARKPHLAKKGKSPDFEPGARKTPEGSIDMSARIRQLARGRR